MTEKITEEIIEYVSALAELELSDAEKAQAMKDMTEMLSYLEQLKQLDADGAAATTHVIDVRNVLRDDVVTNGDCREDVLKNAPQTQDGMLVVPKTIA